MSLRAVVFDLDDTLHDKSATLRRIAQAQYAKADLGALSVAANDWESRYVSLNNERIEKTDVFARLAAEFGIGQKMSSELLKDFDANLGEMAYPYPGAVALVQGCRGMGLKVGIVTNGRDAFQRSKIAGLGLDAMIDCIVTSGGMGIKKPDARIFLECLKRLQVQAHEAAFVGDDFAADMEPSISLGMLAVWKNSSASARVAFNSNELSEIHAFIRSVV